jgi:hypothetical protein
MKWMEWLGGIPGAATFALMACGVLALPLKFPFYDNLLLVVFSAFTYLLAANSASYAFGREEVYRALASGTGDGDRPAILSRVRMPALVALLGWALLLGLSLASLRSSRPAAGLPSPLLLLGLAAFNGGLAWLISMVGAWMGLNIQTVKGTRDLLRMGLTFMLVLLVLAFFVSPIAWRASLARICRNDIQLAAVAALSGGLFLLASEFCLRHILRLLNEKRQGISILG